MAHVIVIGAAAGASCFGPAYELAMIVDAESELRRRHIKWLTSTKITRVDDGAMSAIEHDEEGKPKKEHNIPFKSVPTGASKTGYMIESMVGARKVRTGSVTPVYERYVLKALGIAALKERHR